MQVSFALAKKEYSAGKVYFLDRTGAKTDAVAGEAETATRAQAPVPPPSDRILVFDDADTSVDGDETHRSAVSTTRPTLGLSKRVKREPTLAGATTTSAVAFTTSAADSRSRTGSVSAAERVRKSLRKVKVEPMEVKQEPAEPSTGTASESTSLIANVAKSGNAIQQVPAQTNSMKSTPIRYNYSRAISADSRETIPNKKPQRNLDRNNERTIFVRYDFWQ